MARLLLDGGTDVNYRGYNGKTALIIGCCFLQQKDNEETIVRIVELLLNKGADPNLTDMNGRTAIVHAFRYNASSNVVRLLLKCGANPSISDNKGLTAFCYIKEKSWHVYASCFSELNITSPAHESIKNYAQDIQCVNSKVSTSQRTQSENNEQCFVVPIPAIDSKSIFKNGRRGSLYDGEMLNRRHSSGIDLESTLSRFKQEHLIDGGKGNRRRNSSFGLGNNKLISTSDASLHSREVRFELKSKPVTKDTRRCSVTDVDKSILKRSFVSIPSKLPPIE